MVKNVAQPLKRSEVRHSSRILELYSSFEPERLYFLNAVKMLVRRKQKYNDVI